MRIDKDYLKENKVNTISLVMEWGEEIDIEVEHIIDVSFDIEHGAEEGEYITHDGFVLISSLADRMLGGYISDENEEGKPIAVYQEEIEGDTLKKFLLLTRSISSIGIKMANGKCLSVSIPFDPLKESNFGHILELTNCPSSVLDDNGDMLLQFGKSSQTPFRIDNNYEDLIIGWQDMFEQSPPKILRATITHISNNNADNQKIFVYFTTKDKRGKKEIQELVFEDCTDIHYDIYPCNNPKCDILMTRLERGKIFVDITEFSVCFDCESVRSYDDYCKRDKDE